MLLHYFNTCTHNPTHKQTAQHAFQKCCAVQPIWYSLKSYRFFATFVCHVLTSHAWGANGSGGSLPHAAHLEPFCWAGI